MRMISFHRTYTEGSESERTTSTADFEWNNLESRVFDHIAKHRGVRTESWFRA